MRALGIILAGGKNERLQELTDNRALAAMPIAGSYRTIDFPLSNMTNSGIKRVAVITQFNSRSIMEHLSSSKWWDFGRKQGGLNVFSPYITHESSLWYRGTADAIYQNLSYLKHSHEPYVVLSSGDGIYKIDYNKVLEEHVNKRADITVVCKEIVDGNEDLSRFGVVKTDEDHRIIEFEEKPLEPQSNIVSTGIYIIRRRLLIELMEEISKEGRYDFVNDIIVRYRKKKKIYAYMHTGYWKSISRLDAYYNVNMDFLKKDNRDYFLRNYPYISSKVEDEPPAKYNNGSNVTNSLVSSGCILNGKVQNTVLFRKVFVGENTIIKNSLVLNGSYIGNNCVIENCIIDSHSNILDGTKLIGDPTNIKIVVNRDGSYV